MGWNVSGHKTNRFPADEGHSVDYYQENIMAQDILSSNFWKKVMTKYRKKTSAKGQEISEDFFQIFSISSKKQLYDFPNF
jgi:hypothetical protein